MQIPPIFSGPISPRAYRVTSAFYVAVGILLYTPFAPGMPWLGLDPSWGTVLTYAVERGWQFGTDIIFTYGPFGFLFGNKYLGAFNPVPLVFWAAFHSLIAAAFCIFYRDATVRQWGFLIFATVLLSPGWARDGFVYAAMLQMFLLGRVPGRAAIAVSFGLAVLLGIVSLSKFTFLILSAILVVLTDTARIFEQRKAPLLSAAFVLTILVCYVLAGQHLASFSAFVTNAAEIARGYNEAMQTPGPLAPYVCYVVMCGAVVGSVAWSEQRWISLTALAFAICLFFVSKAGFVRQDLGHLPIALTALTLAALLATRLVARAPREFRWRKSIVAILVATAVVSIVGQVLTHSPYRPLVAARRHAEAVVQMVTGQPLSIWYHIDGSVMRRVEDQYQRVIATIRVENPLPAVPGSVDIFPVDQASLIAAGLDYRPRPVFQSYSAYTPKLAEKNRAFLAGPRAPDHLLFEIGAIDQRFPSLEDGAMWPEILARYQLAEVGARYLLLNRRPIPRQSILTTLREVTVPFGEKVVLSPLPDENIWVEVDTQPSLIGKLAAILTRPPVLHIILTDDTGRESSYRFIPGMGRAGFLISPVVATAGQFADLGNGLPAPSDRVARDFRIVAASARSLQRLLFKDAVTVRIKRLELRDAPE